MSARTFSSIEELSNFFSTEAAGARVCVLHGAASNVTQAVVACAEAHGNAGQPVRVVCADRWAASDLRQAVGERAIEVTTARELACAVLADERVRRATGRSARVLDPNEMDVLMEDLKVTGVAPRRLREMVRFFFKSLADCATDDAHWLINQEEHTVYSVLDENLRARRAVVPEEAALRACEGLEAAPDAVAPAYTIAVDFGAMSKASQRLVRLTSAEGLTVFARTEPMTAPDETYPFFAGVDEWARDPHVRTYEVAETLPPVVKPVIVSDRPFDEFDAVARAAEQAVREEGAPQAVLVAVPNKVWGSMIAKRLEHAHVPVALLHDDEKAPGDPRRAGTCGPVRLAAFAKLARDPNDVVALRTWVGTGDWLMRSDAFLEALAWARDHEEVDMARVFDEMRGDADTKAFHKIARELDALDKLRAGLAGARTAAEARACFSQAGIELDDEQAALIGTRPEGVCLDRLIEAALPAQARTSGAGVVRIAPYALCHALSAGTVVVSGMVAGFMPRLDALDDAYTIDHKAKARDRDRLLLADVEASAAHTVLMSRFSCDRLVNAEALGMRVSRVYVDGTARMARVEPSPFLEV